MNQHEIDSYVLTLKDVPGDDISTLAGRTTAGTEWPVTLSANNLPRISPAACQHVYENMSQASAYRQYARADDVLAGRDHVRVGLIAYQPADAPKVLADLRAALPQCMAFTGPVDKTESLEHPQILPDPHLGDEALEFGITDTDTGEEGTTRAPFHFLLVRKGSVLAWFWAENLPGKPAVLPMRVVNAQLAKLP